MVELLASSQYHTSYLHDEKSIVFSSFESLSHYVDCAKKISKYEREKDKEWVTGDYHSIHYREIEKMICKGDVIDKHLKYAEELLNEVKKNDAVLNKTKEFIQRKGVNFNSYNGDLDLDRVMSGEQEYYRDVKKINKQPVVKIAIQFNGLGYCEQEYFLKGAVVGYILSNILTHTNMNTQIDLINFSDEVFYRSNTDFSCFHNIKVKKHNFKIDLKSLLVCGNSTLMRKYSFMIKSNEHMGKMKTDFGMGRSKAYKNELEDVDGAGLDYDVIISPMEISHKDIVEAVLEQLENIKNIG